MLNSSKAFGSFSVDDIQKAKQFYSGTLGLEVMQQNDYLLNLKVGGGEGIMIYGKPNHTPATYTVLNFPVNDVSRTADALIAKGVKFERYDMPDMTANEKGVYHDKNMGMYIAWFKDPAGNILAILDEM